MQLGSTKLEDHPAGTGDPNALINGNWHSLDGAHNPAFGLTARQDNGTPTVAGTTVTASAALFTADDATSGGALIVWDDGSSALITVFTSSTVVTVSDSKAVVSQTFQIYRSAETLYTALARGLIKKVRFVSADDAKIPAWSDALKRFALVAKPGYGVTAGQVLFGAGAGLDLASSSDLIFDDATNLMTLNGRLRADAYEAEHLAISSGTNIALDFTQNTLQSINTLAHNVAFTSSNRADGRQKALRIVCDGTLRTLTFSEAWKFIGAAAPANIAASKTGILSLTCFGTNATDVVAVWAVEP